MTNRKRICILGSTGSIGTQTIDIIRQNPEQFEAVTLIAGNRVDMLIEQCRELKPKRAIIANVIHYGKLRDALMPLGIEVMSGDKAVAEAMTTPDIDMVVTATVGYSGLLPTIRAIEAGKEIALANKETLVVAGELVNRLLENSRSRIIPVDSEHSAIYQCLVGEATTEVKRLIITASGGPFLRSKAEDMIHVKAADALRHPNWDMGAKITIDSATMLNKAFEIIEAHWLFGVASDRIEPVVHPQSIVHSMVEFADGALKAQLGIPDMHLPISYALFGGQRRPTAERPLTLTDYASLTFEAPDYQRFPCLSLANYSLTRGGNTACIVNAANEIANAAFRRNEIRFTDIYPTIMETIERMPFNPSPTLADYIATNEEARRIASEIIAK